MKQLAHQLSESGSNKFKGSVVRLSTQLIIISNPIRLCCHRSADIGLLNLVTITSAILDDLVSSQSRIQLHTTSISFQWRIHRGGDGGDRPLTELK